MTAGPVPDGAPLGRTLMAGAVASVTHIANPISLARRVLHEFQNMA